MSQKKRKIQVREKGRKVAEHCVFPMICGPGGSKSRLAKAAGAEPCGQTRDKKLQAVVAQSTFPSQRYKTPQLRSTFGSCDVEKVHAVVVRSTFASEKAKNHLTFGSLLELRCRKSARRCGAKQISKSKCTKHTMLGLLLEVEMSKKCMPLWRKLDFRSQNVAKHTYARTLGPLLEVEMSKKCMPLWREAHLQVKSVKNWRSRTRFGTFRCRFAWQAQGIVHLVKSEQNVRVL